MCVRLTECAYVCNCVSLFFKCKRFLTIRGLNVLTLQLFSQLSGPRTSTKKIQPIEEQRKNGESDFLCDLSLSKNNVNGELRRLTVSETNGILLLERNNKNVSESTPHSPLTYYQHLDSYVRARSPMKTDHRCEQNKHTHTQSEDEETKLSTISKYIVDQNSSKV